ncbi:Pectinesterase [Dactylella cylindrospora]|nr:Pectinesterase [Dactylella cylindrospora]
MLSKTYLGSLCLLLGSSISSALPTNGILSERGGIHFTRYSACQIPNAEDPMKHCPQSGVLVDPSMTHISDDYPTFPTIQQAIDFIPHNSRKYTILVMAGTYVEQLNVTRSAPLNILGQTYDPLDRTKNLVKVYWASANNNSRFTDNAFTSVLTVAPNLNASLTGSGPTGFPVPVDTPFGNTDFRAYNIDFVNNAYDYSNGPALAISVSRANAGLYYCGFYSYQDTIYVGKLGNAYFYKNEIAGQTDFLYGFGTAYITHSQLSMRSCGGGVTAWKGTNTTFVNKYGVYISSSDVVAANSTIAPIMKGKCALGRPWNSLHRSIFMDCYLDASIRPSGYIPWSSPIINETLLGEFGSYGPGWNETGRVGSVTRVLDGQEVKPYRTPKDVFMTPDGKKGYIEWIDEQFYAV